ncbi:MAG: hypothetical protein K6T86_12395 [Pirellulales bacterium]|nr:hypothetical protein [Pirellulales bacterium]
MPGSCVLAAGLALWLAGCVALRPAHEALPSRHTLVRGQLVIYSDFALPAHHRLVEELAALRGDLLAMLAMPGSDEPIHVYLFDTPERFRTFLQKWYTGLPERRAFFLRSDTRLVVLAHWGERVAEDLRHEVTHGYLHSVVPQLPLWLDEGLAEYAEVPRGRGGLHEPHLQLLLAEAAAGRWRPSLERLEQLASMSEMTQLDYAESWAWVHLMLHGDPGRRALLQSHLADLRRQGTAVPLSLELRRWFPSSDEALMQYLSQLAAPK